MIVEKSTASLGNKSSKAVLSIGMVCMVQKNQSTKVGWKFSFHGRPHLFRASMNGSGQILLCYKRPASSTCLSLPSLPQSLPEHLWCRKLPESQLPCSIPDGRRRYKHSKKLPCHPLRPDKYSRCLSYQLSGGPSDAGSGRTAFRNCSGTISLPSYRIGSIEVMPTFSKTTQVGQIALSERHKEPNPMNAPLMFRASDSSLHDAAGTYPFRRLHRSCKPA